MNDAMNKSLICGHEGLRLKRYPDSRGLWTIGRGFNLEAPGVATVCAKAGVNYSAVMAGAAITLDQANAIFDSQYASVAAAARRTIPGIDQDPANVGAVVTDMIFELGETGFVDFHHAVAALLARDWPAAIAGLQASKWATQVPSREVNDVALLEALCV
jgi:GH24 family phage-related lysozyme (muramidase)